jgi:hypothetical protein
MPEYKLIQKKKKKKTFWKSPKYMTPPIEPTAAPLYYAANCGFRGLVEHLLIKYPQHVNARGGGRGAALHAASAENHIDVAQLLLEHGGDVNLQGVCKRTPLQFAAIETSRIGEAPIGPWC